MKLETQLLLCVIAGLPTAALLFSLPLGSAPGCGTSALCSLWPACSGSVATCDAGRRSSARDWEGGARGVITAALRARTRGTSASTAVRHLE
jgi:hypothetical protein